MKRVYNAKLANNERGLNFPWFRNSPSLFQPHWNRVSLQAAPSTPRHIVANRILFSVKSRPEFLPTVFLPPASNGSPPFWRKICPVLERPTPSLWPVSSGSTKKGGKVGRNSARVRGCRWEGGTRDNFPSYHQMPWAIYFTPRLFLIRPFIPYIFLRLSLDYLPFFFPLLLASLNSSLLFIFLNLSFQRFCTFSYAFDYIYSSIFFNIISSHLCLQLHPLATTSIPFLSLCPPFFLPLPPPLLSRPLYRIHGIHPLEPLSTRFLATEESPLDSVHVTRHRYVY